MGRSSRGGGDGGGGGDAARRSAGVRRCGSLRARLGRRRSRGG